MAVKFKQEHSRTSEYRFFPENIKIKPELNGRHDKPDIEWLIADILTRGQIQPVTIRNDGGEAVLTAGFSRWRAISEINKRKLSPVKMQLRCMYVQCNEAEAFMINISENRLRNQTTPIDDAHNIKRLINIYAMTEEQVAALYFPTMRTEDEIKESRKFIKNRVALLSLTAEAEAAVRSGRVKESAAVAISKLSEAQQNEALKKEGTIERKDLKPPTVPKPPKPIQRDAELMRRITALLEDVEGLLEDPTETYIQVERIYLLNLSNYVKEIKL